MKSLMSDGSRRGPFKNSIVAGIILALVGSVLGLLGSAAPAGATGSTGDDCTYEWVRSIAQSHPEYKYKKTIPAVAGVKEYKYKKEVKTYKTQHWAKYQKHVKGRVEKHVSGSWRDTGTDFDWTKWEGDFWNTTGSFKVRDWADTASPDVIEEGGHGSVSDTYVQNGYTYRLQSERYSYRVIDRQTREVQTGSTWEYSDWTTEVRGAPWIKVEERWKTEPVPAYDVYYVTGGGSTTTNTDANWTRDTPGSPWVKFDQRTVQDQPINQGPVRSANEPDRGQYPNVPWTKVPGSGICVVDVPTVPVIDECGPGNAVYGVVPDGPWTVVRNNDGSLIITANQGTTFPGGSTSVTKPTPTDSNTPCPDTVVQPPTIPVVDECGPGNAAYGPVPVGPWTSVTNPDGSVTVTANSGNTFPNGPSVTYPVPADSNVPCPTDEPKPKKVKGKAKMVDKCGTAGDLFAVMKHKGVVYTADGQRIREGVWLKTGGDRKVVVKAKAASKKFKLVGKSKKWVFRFDNRPCGNPDEPPDTGARMVA